MKDLEEGTDEISKHSLKKALLELKSIEAIRRVDEGGSGKTAVFDLSEVNEKAINL